MDVVKIGAFIKSQRTELKLTQKELAKRIGCTDKAVSRWETGKGLPDMSFLMPLSKELDVSINEILIGEKIAKDSENLQEADVVAEIVGKTEENIINVIEQSQKKLKHQSRISVSLCVLSGLQMIIFFVVPNIIPNNYEPFEMMLFLSVLVSVFVGLCRNKFKWLFPFAISSVFFLINLFFRTDEGFLGFILSLYFAAGSLLIIAVCSLISYIYRKLKKQ
ncbi:MAG: helix-turn-helix domain-containing protein [Clostridia bacterium]|nr:helix-turn-helix domain-containing protein [Clostridia bacterium]